MNVAKLTAVDLPLFNGITSDLFPGVEVPQLDYGVVCLDFQTCNCYIHHSGTPLNGHPSTADTHDITDSSESPDCLPIHFNT